MNTTARISTLALLALSLTACDTDGTKLNDRNGDIVLPGEQPDQSEEDNSEESEGEEQGAESGGKDKAKDKSKKKGKPDASDKGKGKAKGKNKFDCVHHHAFWKTNIQRMQPKKVMEWPLEEGTKLCEESYADILWTAPRENLGFYKLSYQYIAAQLNLALGAAPTDAVQAAIDKAGELLGACDKEAVDAGETRDTWKLIHAFNHGQTDHSCGNSDEGTPKDETTPGDEGTPEDQPTPTDEGTPEDQPTPSDEGTPEDEGTVAPL